jgi:hypothetical protein
MIRRSLTERLSRLLSARDGSRHGDSPEWTLSASGAERLENSILTRPSFFSAARRTTLVSRTRHDRGQVWWSNSAGARKLPAVNEVILAAAELQAVCESQGWEFCFIGGLALQRWVNRV